MIDLKQELMKIYDHYDEAILDEKVKVPVSDEEFISAIRYLAFQCGADRYRSSNISIKEIILYVLNELEK